MTKRTWEIRLDDRIHTIEVFHEYWSGRRRILVDGSVVVKDSGINAGGLFYEFVMGSHNGYLEIVTNGLAYRYILFVNDTPYLAKEDDPKDKLIQTAIKESLYWRDMAQLTGLKYVAVPKTRGFWKHRLVGAINGDLIVLRFGMQERQRLILNGVIRYSPALNLDDLKLQVKTDESLIALLGKSAGDNLEFGDSHVWVTFSYKPKKESTEVIAKKLESLVSVLSKYVNPLHGDICNSKTCKRESGQPLKVVFLNAFPLLLCQSCINDMPNWGKRAGDEYRRVPLGLFKGTLAGIVVATLGGIAWAVLTVLLKRVAAVFGGAIFVGIIKAMYKVGMKRNIISILIAAVLAVYGVFLGSYLTVLWLVLRDTSILTMSFDMMWFELKVAWELMWANPELLHLSLFFGLLGIILYLIIVWVELNGHFQRAFHPKIEVIGNKWF